MVKKNCSALETAVTAQAFSWNSSSVASKYHSRGVGTGKYFYFPHFAFI